MTRKELRKVPLADFRAELEAQGVEALDYAFICPMCETIQSARMLIAAGAGKDFEEVSGQLGFSCIGRHTGAGSAREKGKGCNWTLGGLFQTHNMVVITEDGKEHPHFEAATPDEAKELARKNGVEL